MSVYCALTCYTSGGVGSKLQAAGLIGFLVIGWHIVSVFEYIMI